MIHNFRLGGGPTPLQPCAALNPMWTPRLVADPHLALWLGHVKTGDGLQDVGFRDLSLLLMCTHHRRARTLSVSCNQCSAGAELKV